MQLIIMLVLLFAIMYFFMIRPLKKRQNEIQKFHNKNELNYMDNTNSNNSKRQSASDALSQWKENRQRQRVSQYAQTSKPTIKSSNNNSNNSSGDDGCGMEIFIYIIIGLVIFVIFSFF